MRIFNILNAFGNFTLAEYTQTFAPWHRKSSLGNHEHCSMKKPFALGEKTLPFGIPINVRQPVIAPDALSWPIK
jgi:hypothetical protein